MKLSKRLMIAFLSLAAAWLSFFVCTNEKPSQNIDIDTTPNDRPIIVPMSDTAISINDTLRLIVKVTDDDTSFYYRFKTDGENYYSTVDPFMNLSFPDTGTHTIVVTVNDEHNLISLPESLIVHVTSSTPAVTISSPATGAIYDSIKITANGKDLDGRLQYYLWSTDKTHYDTTTVNVWYVSWNREQAGKHVVYGKVIDDDNLVSNIDSTSVVIHTYAPSIALPSDTSISVNDTLALTFTVSDTNNGTMTMLWSSDKVQWDTVQSSVYKKTYPVDAAGYDTLYAKGIDNDGMWSGMDSIVIFIYQYRPLVTMMKDTAGSP